MSLARGSPKASISFALCLQDYTYKYCPATPQTGIPSAAAGSQVHACPGACGKAQNFLEPTKVLNTLYENGPLPRPIHLTKTIR